MHPTYIHPIPSNACEGRFVRSEIKDRLRAGRDVSPGR